VFIREYPCKFTDTVMMSAKATFKLPDNLITKCLCPLTNVTPDTLPLRVFFVIEMLFGVSFLEIKPV